MPRRLLTYNNIKYVCTGIIMIIAVALYYSDVSKYTQFVLACIALIPLAGLIGDATESLGDLTNELIGGLLSASFGNAPELIFSIISLFKNLDGLIKGSLIGSIVGNMLLVLGSALLVGGYHNGIQNLKHEIVHSAGFTLLVIGTFIFTFPSAAVYLNNTHTTSLSVTTSIVFVLIYIAYTCFQITNTIKSTKNSEIATSETASISHSTTVNQLEDGVQVTNVDDVSIHVPSHQSAVNLDENEHVYANQHSIKRKQITINVVILFAASGLVALMSEIITANVSDIATNVGVSQEFIGFIIIAILGNAAEHWTAISCAYANKIDISITTVESSALQIMMLILPLMNFISFARTEPFLFIFTIKEMIALSVTTLVVWLVIADAKTNWLEGIALIGLYVLFFNMFLI